MRSRLHIRNALILLILVGTGYALLRDRLPTHDPAAEAPAPLAETTRLVVYYFAQGKDCATCEKLPVLTRAALEKYFSAQLDDGTIAWRPVNVETPANAHFVHDYQIYTKAVVLSLRRGGEETQSKNLERVWDFVGDDNAFIDYIRAEVQAALDTAA